MIWSLYGEIRHIASCNISAVNNELIIHLKIFLQNFCFVMKLISYRSTCTAKSPGTLNSNAIICSMSIFLAFFKSILCVKTGEVEVNRYSKMVQKMVTLTKHVIPGPDLHCAGPLALWGFLHHLPAT